jgi:ketosteroid isomerase-like protein
VTTSAESSTRLYLEELIDAGDRVGSVSTARAIGRASGLDVARSNHAAVWTIREGQIVRMVWYPSRAAALEAVGLSE